MKTKKIFILMGNEDKDTTCGRMADAYERGARAAGHEVKRVNISDLHFDPILHQGYKAIQNLEPDLKQLQEDIKWAEHVVLLYPTWWSAMPALLKGMFDRMWLPGFAFHFHKEGMGWHGLLHGRSAHVIVTMDSWPLVERIFFGDSTNEIGRAILRFAGFHPVKIKKIGPLKTMPEARKQAWMQKIEKLGRRGI
jgi:NAD(P)H dehydrogenase (quinone)